MWLIVLSDQLPVSLGGPLPRQLADRPRAHLKAPGLAVPGFSRGGMTTTTTCGISQPFGWLFHTFRKITHVLRTRLPLKPTNIATRGFSLDLHVLTTPPAFVLSQNQTLRNKSSLPALRPGLISYVERTALAPSSPFDRQRQDEQCDLAVPATLA